MNPIYIRILAIIVIVGGGIILLGFPSNNGPPDIPDIQPTPTIPEISPTPTSPLSTSPSLTPIEKVSAEALGCVIVPGGFKVDLRLKNPDVNTKKITISPPGRIFTLSPSQIIRTELILAKEDLTMSVLVDDGTEDSIQMPTCISGGGSEAGLSLQQPVPPVPELPTIALTSAGIFGLLLLSLRKKD